MSGAWLRRRPARVPAWVVDAGWAMVVGVAVTIAIRVAREPGARPPDLLAYALGGRSLPCWFVAGPIVVRIFVDPEPALTVLGEVVRDASLWLATLLLGALTREHRLLEVERARSERLLDNMLPEPIAERLKQQEGDGGRWPAPPHGRPCRGSGRAGLGDARGRDPPQVP